MRISDWSSDVCSSDLHRLDVEGSEQPRIDADIGEIVLPFDDLTKRLRECLQRIVRAAAEYHHAPCPRRILDELPKRLWRHRQAGKGNPLRGLAAPCPGVRRRALNHLVPVDRAGRAGWQIGRGHPLPVLPATPTG